MTAFGGQFVIDDFAHFMKWLVIIGASLAIIMSINFNEQEGIGRFEYPVLILFAALGMFMMVSTSASHRAIDREKEDTHNHGNGVVLGFPSLGSTQEFCSF